jgi:hypothetical protein
MFTPSTLYKSVSYTVGAMDSAIDVARVSENNRVVGNRGNLWLDWGGNARRKHRPNTGKLDNNNTTTPAADSMICYVPFLFLPFSVVKDSPAAQQHQITLTTATNNNPSTF